MTLPSPMRRFLRGFYFRFVFVFFFAAIFFVDFVSNETRLHEGPRPPEDEKSAQLSSLPLRAYQILAASEVTVDADRRDPEGRVTQLRVAFRAFGAAFSLYLAPSRVLGAGFRAFVVGAAGDAERLGYAPGDAFFNGRVMGLGDEDGAAVAEMTPDGKRLRRAFVAARGTEYYLEEMKEEGEDSSYLVYRGSDVSTDDLRAANLAPKTFSVAWTLARRRIEKRQRWRLRRNDADSLSARSRRNPAHDDDDATTCKLRLVADHNFYVHMGNKDNTTTINYLIGTVDRMNKLYQRTTFYSSKENLTNFGFQVHEIVIHHYPRTAGHSYNTPLHMSSEDLLKKFSLDENNADFCLAHLFTYRKFSGGVLGLAYTAPSKDEPHKEGGICARKIWSKKDGRYLMLNTGLSTSMNYAGRRLITKEADLVVAHEMGHGWGSEHDPEKCIHDPGGHYIMHMYSVTGHYRNNEYFSSCSKSYIGETLSARRHRRLDDGSACFVKADFTYCGNHRVEKGEECDSGQEEDPCCSGCRLDRSRSAKCSPANNVCCTATCTFASSSVVCADSTSVSTCDGTAYCTGVDARCGRPTPRPAGSPCLEGTCNADGMCVWYCESIGRSSCVCNETKDSCSICCNDGRGCKPSPEFKNISHTDGWPCGAGACEAGVCVTRHTRDRVLRYFQYFVQNEFVVVLRDNIVLFVQIFTAFFWIPLSCVVLSWDKKRKEEWKEIFEDEEWSRQYYLDDPRGFFGSRLSFSGEFEGVGASTNELTMEPRERSGKNVSFGLWDLASSEDRSTDGSDLVEHRGRSNSLGSKTVFPLEPSNSDLYKRRKSFASAKQKSFDLSVDVIPEESASSLHSNSLREDKTTTLL